MFGNKGEALLQVCISSILHKWTDELEFLWSLEVVCLVRNCSLSTRTVSVSEVHGDDAGRSLETSTFFCVFQEVVTLSRHSFASSKRKVAVRFPSWSGRFCSHAQC